MIGDDLGFEIRLILTKVEMRHKVAEAPNAESICVLTRIEVDQAFNEHSRSCYRPVRYSLSRCINQSPLGTGSSSGHST